jgi:WD40 repeat protein
VAFAAGDDRLAAAGEDQIVRLWRVSDGVLLQSLEGAGATVAALAFDARGTLLASGTSAGTVQVWEVTP